jgi:hypothetical protein
MSREGRLLSSDWDLYDTRHAVFQPAGMLPERLEQGYWWAYKNFYSWSNLWEAASVHEHPLENLRHLAYAAGWKKFEPLWDWVIRARRVAQFLPVLESLLAGFSIKPPRRKSQGPGDRPPFYLPMD